MTASAQSAALMQIAVLLLFLSVGQADFLDGVHFQHMAKPDVIKFEAGQLQHALPPRMPRSSDMAHMAQDKVPHDKIVWLGSHLGHSEAIKVISDKRVADGQHRAAGLLRKGAGAASRVKFEDVPKALSGIAGDKAVTEMKRVVEGMHSGRSGGVAAALRGTTSQMAATVNQTSARFSEFLQSFGPRASVLLNRSGEALACKFSGDCASSSEAEVLGESELPLDPQDPETWSFWGFALFLIVALCAMSAGLLRFMYVAGRKGSILLSEAMVPLTEPSARQPAVRLSHDGLLG